MSLTVNNSRERYVQAEQRAFDLLSQMVADRIARCQTLIKQLTEQIGNLEEQAASQQNERGERLAKARQLKGRLNEFNPQVRLEECRGRCVSKSVMTGHLFDIGRHKRRVIKHLHMAEIDSTEIVRETLYALMYARSYGGTVYGGVFPNFYVRSPGMHSGVVSDQAKVLTQRGASWDFLRQRYPGQYEIGADDVN